MYSTTLTSAPVQSAIRLSRNPFGTAVNGITRYSFASETASVSAGISPPTPPTPQKSGLALLAGNASPILRTGWVGNGPEKDLARSMRTSVGRFVYF